jgi:hypothetical protein
LGLTRSMTWICFGSGGWAGSSPGCGHRPRWERSCGRSPSVMSGSRDAVASRLLVNLATHPPLLPGGDQVTFVDVDDTVKQSYGYAKQGAGAGTPALVLARMDSAFYNADVVATVRRSGAKFSITRPDGQGCTGGDRLDRRRRVDADQVPQRLVGRSRAGLDLHRRGCRNHLHRVHPPSAVRTGHRPTDRAPGSPTAASNSSRPRATSAATRSSSRSSPTSRVAVSLTYPQGPSTPMPPGWSAPRSRST